jgi:hypothetical protein
MPEARIVSVSYVSGRSPLRSAIPIRMRTPWRNVSFADCGTAGLTFSSMPRISFSSGSRSSLVMGSCVFVPWQ